MNPETGAIAEFETKEDAKAAGHTVPLGKREADHLYPMNRKMRRAALAKSRAESKSSARKNRRKSQR